MCKYEEVRACQTSATGLVSSKHRTQIPLFIYAAAPKVLYLPGQVRARCRYVCHCAGE